MTREEFESLIPGTLVKDNDGDRAVYLGTARDLILTRHDDENDAKVFHYIEGDCSTEVYWRDTGGVERPGWLIFRPYWAEDMEILCTP